MGIEVKLALILPKLGVVLQLLYLKKIKTEIKLISFTPKWKKKNNYYFATAFSGLASETKAYFIYKRNLNSTRYTKVNYSFVE